MGSAPPSIFCRSVIFQTGRLPLVCLLRYPVRILFIGAGFSLKPNSLKSLRLLCQLIPTISIFFISVNPHCPPPGCFLAKPIGMGGACHPLALAGYGSVWQVVLGLLFRRKALVSAIRM